MRWCIIQTMFDNKKLLLEKIALRATRWIGSTESLVVHTLLFTISFVLVFFGISFDHVLLVVTTIVSLEAIYLSIFIQMSVNRSESRLHEVSQDIEEIQEDVESIEEDIDEIQEDIEEDDVVDSEQSKHLEHIRTTLSQLIAEVEGMKSSRK